MKMKFPFEIKYLGEYYSPNEIIEVEEKDVEELVALGGKVAEKPTIPPPKSTIKAKRGRKSDTA